MPVFRPGQTDAVAGADLRLDWDSLLGFGRAWLRPPTPRFYRAIALAHQPEHSPHRAASLPRTGLRALPKTVGRCSIQWPSLASIVPQNHQLEPLLCRLICASLAPRRDYHPTPAHGADAIPVLQTPPRQLHRIAPALYALIPYGGHYHASQHQQASKADCEHQAVHAGCSGLILLASDAYLSNSSRPELMRRSAKE